MPRKRLTQIFPLLLPLRKWQRKKLFYLKMHLSESKYAKVKSAELLPNKIFETSSLMLNQNSGFDIKYQQGKVHNLKLAARTVNGILIRPGETFSFWQLVRFADRREPYKEGLKLVDGRIVGDYGGGLCQLSGMLFWLFLHTPLTVVERHGHAVESIPPATEDLPCGTDAAISEGWLDLKIRNDTDNTFQIGINFDDNFMYGCILSQNPLGMEYSVFNSSVSYVKRQEKTYQTAVVCLSETDKKTFMKKEKNLYVNQCEIAYELPDSINVKEITTFEKVLSDDFKLHTQERGA